MRRRSGWIAAGLLVLAVGSLAGLAAGRDTPTDHVRPRLAGSGRDLFEVLATPPRVGSFGGGAWCWFQDPRAVSFDGRTYVGWIARNGNLIVGAYSAARGTRTHVIGHWIHDDHASPVLLIEPDRRLTVFWADHNGHTMNYRTTLRPEDITAWGRVGHVRSALPGNLGFTYPNPVIVPREGNRLYLFWRGAKWGVDYATRSASGQWSAAHELISLFKQRPYLKVAGNGRDEIALAFTDAHPADMNTNVYYAVYRAGSLWTAGGRRITRLGHGPIAPDQAQLVYDGRARGVPSWVWDVAFDGQQRPVIVYATFPSKTHHAYWYARWNGVRWASHFLTFAGSSISPGTIQTYYSGGIALDHANPSVLYLSRQDGRWFRIERWSTSDGGDRWRHVTIVSIRGDAVRPVVPRGSADGPISLLWMGGHYGSYIRYGTSINFRTS
jgi:BNR repeat-containing family member